MPADPRDSRLRAARRLTASSPTIAVVLPALNEARRIARRLEEHAAAGWAREIIVVDGGSEDDTTDLARAFTGVRVVAAARGRGPQMNAGAALATSDVVLFQHVDVALPPDAPNHVARALGDAGVVAGAFRIRTVADAGRNRLGPLLRLADRRARRTRHPYGDQALFVRRNVFFDVGGFPDQPLMEDVEIARRLWRRGRIVTVDAEVLVSARRFLARPLRSVVAMHLFPSLYRAGVSPTWLARLYGAPR